MHMPSLVARATRQQDAVGETALHAAIVLEMRRILPPGYLVHHSPNEGKRGRQAQADLKAMGTVAGWPDLEIIGPATRAGTLPAKPARPCAILFMEVKARGGALRPEQRAVHAALQALGHQVAVVYSVADARAAVAAWLDSDDDAGIDKAA